MTARATSSGVGSSSLGSPDTQTASYILTASDAGKAVELNSASSTTVTVPPNSDVPFAIGTVIEVARYGTGGVTLAAGAGVTIRTESGLSIQHQYGSASLRKRATDEWVVVGDILTSSAATALQPSYRSGWFYRTASSQSAVASIGNLAGYVWLAPVRIPSGTTFSKIGVIVDTTATAASVFRLGIYGDDGTGLPTGAPLLDAGAVAADASGNQEATINWTASDSGLYHPVAVLEGGTGGSVRSVAPLGLSGFPTNTIAGNSSARVSTGMTGALQTWAWTFTTNDSTAPMIYLKVA